MRAEAPGKLVISGAYAVLRGAPAVVVAVDRRVKADSSRSAPLLTPEVSAALAELFGETRVAPAAPHFAAEELRQEDRKLGLGSSAAILLSSLGALHPELQKLEAFSAANSSREFQRAIFPWALRAHRKAQGGGSGIDVAASTFGGVLGFRLEEDGAPALAPRSLPPGIFLECWSHPFAAKTSEFITRVFALESVDGAAFHRHLSAQTEASANLDRALSETNWALCREALGAQVDVLSALGDLAQVPIVLPEVRQLGALLGRGAVLLPAGAGGGDLSCYFGTEPSPPEFRQMAQTHGMTQIELGLDLRGLTFGDEVPT